MLRSSLGCQTGHQIHRSLLDAGVTALLRREAGNGWIVRFGPVEREQMLAVLTGYVW